MLQLVILSFSSAVLYMRPLANERYRYLPLNTLYCISVSGCVPVDWYMYALVFATINSAPVPSSQKVGMPLFGSKKHDPRVLAKYNLKEVLGK